MWTELIHSLNVRMCLTNAYHPQSDGQTEHIRVLEDNLRHDVAPIQDMMQQMPLPCASDCIKGDVDLMQGTMQAAKA